MSCLRFSFCHGWVIDKNFNEETCKNREKCQYYSEDFYRHYRDRLDEFEEMFPFAPCKFLLPKQVEEKEQNEETSLLDELFSNLDSV